MCGFIGYISKKLDSIDPSLVSKMMQLQQHRGPDDSGSILFSLKEKKAISFNEQNYKNLNKKVHANNFNGGMGFNRLSIMDVSSSGHQPMSNQDNSIYLMFNGEIYNAFDLKKKFVNSNYKFQSKTDTEVILALYEQYGLEYTLQKLNGMFAICILDLKKNEIYLARDRFGIKPLYYILNKNFFSFSSEIKSFSAIKDFKFKLNKEKLSEYFIFKYLVPPYTLIKDIKFLAPGEIMVFKNNKIEIKSYLDFQNFNKEIDPTINKLKTLEKILKKSVKSQLMSDVNLGCQLSGGIDSSLISLFAKNFTNKLDTFSILFEEKNLSEEMYIKKVVNKLKLTNYSSEFNYKNFYNDLSNCIWYFDAPLSQINSVGLYNLAKLAKRRVKVLLSGEGADEVHGGYPRYTRLNFFSLVNKMLKKNMLPLSLICKRFKIFEFRNISDLNRDDLIILSSSVHSYKDITNLIPKIDLHNGLDTRRKIINTIKLSGKQKSIVYEMKTYMHDLFIKQDKMTMAHSIENRVPYLDNAIVDFSIANLADSNFEYSFFKNINHKTKKYLKIISQKYFGKSFSYRSKSGFSFPLKQILKSKYFREPVENEIMPEIKISCLYNFEKINKIWKNIENSSTSELELIYSIIAFEIWLKKFKVSF